RAEPQPLRQPIVTSTRAAVSLVTVWHVLVHNEIAVGVLLLSKYQPPALVHCDWLSTLVRVVAEAPPGVMVTATWLVSGRPQLGLGITYWQGTVNVARIWLSASSSC